MQRKLIKVGEEYLVEVDGLIGPGTLKAYGDDIVMEHGYTYRGVSKRHGKKVRATVKAVDQKRPVRCSGTRYSGTCARVSNDGVLVEFHEPQKIGFYNAAPTTTTAVLSTKHIIKPWAEHAERVAARKAYETERDSRILNDAEAFAPEIISATEKLVAAGFTVIERERSLLFSKGDHSGIIDFKVERTSGRHELITGWSRSATIDRELLFSLLT